MHSYIILTNEGRTLLPSAEGEIKDIENMQVLGFSQGPDKKSAIRNFYTDNPWFNGSGFSDITVLCLKDYPKDSDFESMPVGTL